MSISKIFLPTLFLVACAATTANADQPWLTSFAWSDLVQQSAHAEQPEGVTVTVKDGHAIIDFSERAKSNANVTMQFIDPMGPDVEPSTDQWTADVSRDPLIWCLQGCEDVTDPAEKAACIKRCEKRYGEPVQ